jgi:hypothetical protein
MKGFFYENVIELLRQYRWMLAMVVLFLVVGLSQKNAAYWGVYAEMVFGSFAGTLVRSDEVSGWNQYVRLLPISGKTAVSSFYIVPYLMMGVTTALYTIAALIVRAYSHGTYLIFPAVYLMIVLPFVITAITIPITIWFGSVKAPVVQMILVVLMVAAAMFALTNGADVIARLMNMNVVVFAAASFAAVAAVVAVSWFLSVRAWESKKI